MLIRQKSCVIVGQKDAGKGAVMRNKDMKQEEDGQQGEKKDLAILAVSFGTVHPETREKTIGAVESELQSAYPEAEIRRVFTSQEVIERLKKQEGLWIPNLEEALSKAAADGIRRIPGNVSSSGTGRK